MAVSASLLTTGGSNTAVTSIATASITPTANRLVAVYIVTDNGAPTSLSGNGLTWVQEILDTTLVPITVWRSMGASPSAGAITINLAANSVISWVVIEYDGVDTSGSNGSGAIVASQDASTTGSAVTSLQVTLPAGVTAGNAVAAMFINGASAAMTAGGSYANLGETTASGFVDQAHEWNATGTQTPSMSWTGSANAAGLAIEIVAAGAAAAADQSYRPAPLSVVRYKIPALRGLRTFTSELTTVPPSASGATSGEQRVAGFTTGVKGAVGAEAAQQRSSGTTAAAKQASGDTASGQRTSGQAGGAKGAAGATVGQQRTAGLAVRGTPPAGPTVGMQRVMGLSAGRKGAADATAGTQRTSGLTSGIRRAVGAASGQQRTAGTSAAAKQASGATSGQVRSSGMVVVTLTPPPRWVEGSGGGTAIREATSSSTASTEGTSGGAAFKEGVAGGAGTVEGASGGTGFIEGSGGV